MKRGHYYVVNVKHLKNNPQHRTIVKCIDENKSILDFIDYPEYTRKSIKELYYIDFVSEIKDMIN